MGLIDTGLPAGGMIFESNAPGFLGPSVINSYTTLAIPAYWRAMNYISANMASFPRFVAKANARVEHRLDPLLNRRPNGFQNCSTFWRALFFHRAHYGNAYAEILRDTQFQPKAFFPHVPENVLPFRFLDDSSGDVLTYYHCGQWNGRDAHIVAAADMIHLTGVSWDGLAGLNPVAMLGDAFERARLVDRYITRFLVKGTVVKGSIEIPTGVSKEQVEAILDTIHRNFRGANAERDVLLLTDGAKLNNATLTNQEAQLIEQAQYTTKQIAQITGVPPAYLFDDADGKYNANVEQAGQMVVRDLFRPLIEQDEDELSLKLLTDKEAASGLEIKFDPSALIRGDVATTTNTAVAKVKAGIETKNEGRKDLGLPPINDPEADKLMTLGASSPPAAPPPQE